MVCVPIVNDLLQLPVAHCVEKTPEGKEGEDGEGRGEGNKSREGGEGERERSRGEEGTRNEGLKVEKKRGRRKREIPREE